MESFYGGRQGASFIIVKRFDGINIPQEEGAYVYKTAEYAVNLNGTFITPLVEKTTANYLNYSWSVHAKDGSLVNGTGPEKFPEVRAEGMVQCFSKGGESASEVNYGEYVLIDTACKNNPDNGKVFRRGMNYDYNVDTNPFAGGEYIGDISGPQGNTPELNIDTVDEIKAKTPHREGVYKPEDMVPGSYISSTGNRDYNDNIEYAWTTLKDAYGNVIGCLIGFKTPYLVNHMTSKSVNAYYNRSNETAIFENQNLISKIDDGQHPFFSEWQVSIPKGVKGNSAENLEIINTMAKKDAPFYGDTSLTILLGALSDNKPLLTEQFHSSAIYAPIELDGAIVYVNAEDTYKTVLRYKQTSYDRAQEGDSEYINLGDYNTIESVSISPTGLLTVHYSADSNKVLEEAIRWIYLKKETDGSYTKGIELKDDGSVLVTYNTLDEFGDNQSQNYENVMTWVTAATLDANGDFEIIYNNNKIANGAYNTHLQWINQCVIDADGTVHFIYNDGVEAYTKTKFLKVLSNVVLDHDAGTGIEGTGDQKIHLQYNTGETSITGAPINYIMETLVTEYRTETPNTKASHLIVLYSDPAYRENMRVNGKCVTYRSVKFQEALPGGGTIGQLRNDWVDLGSIKGEAGGLHIIGNITNLSALKDGSGKWLPPELIAGNNTDQAGWAYTLNGTEIYVFDYKANIWYSIGSINAESILPEKTIIVSEPSSTAPDKPPLEKNTLNTNGIWLISETRKYAI